ncbi:MAG: methylated-DNA--[Eggerthellaceae bacterium]|nr:methylated-DNA--[protein]-cysteine S-methyltransferase [Eggerthellaceae bacterium]
MRYLSHCDSPVGELTLAGDGAAVCGLWLEGQKYYCAKVPEGAPADDGAPGFDALRRWLDAYFAGERPAIADVPLAPRGSDFQQHVWRILAEIPYGGLTTYGEMAVRIARERGRATSALVVGGAVGHNPVSVVAPCHRVVGASGSLTGYAGGLDRERWLLMHEGVDMGGMFTPKRGTVL